MAQFVSAEEIFGGGSAKLFAKIRKDPQYQEQAARFTDMAGATREAHVLGCPNTSFTSTSNAGQSLGKIIKGLASSEQDIPEEHFFGENIREALKGFKDFLNK